MAETAYGVPIERGKVTHKTANGYRIQSYSRPGLTTPEIPAALGTDANEGDEVAFFLFEDGQGLLLFKLI